MVYVYHTMHSYYSLSLQAHHCVGKSNPDMCMVFAYSFQLDPNSRKNATAGNRILNRLIIGDESIKTIHVDNLTKQCFYCTKLLDIHRIFVPNINMSIVQQLVM